MKDYFFKTVALMNALGLVELHNARGEFACNSSSSHSVLVLPTAPGDSTLLMDSDESDFDGDITLTSSTAKVRYLAALLAQNDRADLAAELRSTIKEWSEFDSVGEGKLPTIDDRFGDISAEFAREFAQFLRRDEVAIIGTEYDDHELERLDGSFRLPFPSFGGWVARRDEVNGQSWWVLFSGDDGTKLRLNFRDPSRNFEPAKAQTPELVDVKVTDRCPFELDCGFCYMGSTRDGVEANVEDVTRLLTSLSEMGVFEIAFGGGEPTLWPHFADTLAMTRSLGMVPNFTTKNYKVLQDEKLMSLAGSVAFSVTDAKSFERFKKNHTAKKYYSSTVCVQIIPEIIPDDLLEEIFAYSAENYMRLTLLGYKTTGRGDQFDGRIARPADFWVPLARRHQSLRLSIDTMMALNSKEALEAEGVPEWTYHTEEGRFSMYCDAVKSKAAASSYIDPSQYDDVDLSSADLTGRLADLFKGY